MKILLTLAFALTVIACCGNGTRKPETDTPKKEVAVKPRDTRFELQRKQSGGCTYVFWYYESWYHSQPVCFGLHAGDCPNPIHDYNNRK